MGGRYAERHGYGLVIFASVLLLVLACFNLIDGIAAIANSHVFGSLRSWGWITMILGVLQLAAAAGVLAGNQLGSGRDARTQPGAMIAARNGKPAWRSGVVRRQRDMVCVGSR
jgi:hypothetical protein